MTQKETRDPIEVVVDAPEPVAAGHLWAPTLGDELAGLLKRSGLDDEGAARVEAQALDVMARTLPPHGGRSQDRRTGLVVGYVQSGKTMSFTSVIALARDNDVPLVVLFSGTKDNLHQQTTKRLERDLEMSRIGTPWVLMDNPKKADAATLAGVLKGWLADAPTKNKFLAPIEEERRTVVITVMKNRSRLGRVELMLQALADYGIEISQIPTLVVDDEADQAGLNTRPAFGGADEEDPSATYKAIADLREAIPVHTYLEYTATPQAPLLLNLLDTLSPDFVTVLQPGADYTGGSYFFKQNRDTFVELIPATELDKALDIKADTPPESLAHAIAQYVVGGVLLWGRGIPQTSMLVHPSHSQELHERYADWVKQTLKAWSLSLVDGGESAQLVVDTYLRPAYQSLAPEASEDDLPALVEAVHHFVSLLQVRKVNSSNPEESLIKWDLAKSWILVGGNKLDRGYTVEGLTVTYMPRGIGTGMADTVQQRARFFGYKKKYADVCRAWLTTETARVYERYVEHEEALRTELARVAADGEDLKVWRRRMLLDSSLKPCRSNVVSLPYVREQVKANTWHQLNHINVPSRVDGNRTLLDKFVGKHGEACLADPRDKRGGPTNTVFRVPLPTLIELLMDWELHVDDAAVRNAALTLLAARVDEAAAGGRTLHADVYLLDNLQRRQRALKGDSKVAVLNFQAGRSTKDPAKFPGDKDFYTDSADVVSVQLQRIDILSRPNSKDVVLADVPAVSLRVPRDLAGSVIEGLQ